MSPAELNHWQEQVAYAKKIYASIVQPSMDGWRADLAAIDPKLCPGTACAFEVFLEMNEALGHADAFQYAELRELIKDLNDLTGWVIRNDSSKFVERLKSFERYLSLAFRTSNSNQKY